MRIDIVELNKSFKDYSAKTVEVSGWVKTVRDSKTIAFIELGDGSSFKGVQIILESGKVSNFDEIIKLNVGASINVVGTVVETPQAKQAYEINADTVEVLGQSTPDYPLQKKRHSLEYLRSIAHLRPKTNMFTAAFRVRSEAAFAIHEFFNSQGFVYANTPLITGSDCEGAGEMFKVTTLDFENPPKNEDGSINYGEDFFGKQTSLTVSGQLEGECMAMAFGKIYTFGPTFRAEKSNTTRHAAEFWMIEPEVAFMELPELMDLSENMLKFVINRVLEKCPDELNFFNSFVDKGLVERITSVANSSFGHVTYTEAIEILENCGKEFEFPVYWGCDLQTEHERYLTEVKFGKPLFVTDYPKDIKAFYMRVNEDGKTVKAMDCLVPAIGEIIGGSQREERYDVLVEKIEEMGFAIEDYDWYLDLRKYGSVKHSGFGLGFERLIMYLTGISNIRDVIPFPRTIGNAEY